MHRYAAKTPSPEPKPLCPVGDAPHSSLGSPASTLKLLWGRLLVMIRAFREAALKPSAARVYPYLAVGIWAPAIQLAKMVAEVRGIRTNSMSRPLRLLSARHFLFRGGGPSIV
jgi:hypothetical protein